MALKRKAARDKAEPATGAAEVAAQPAPPPEKRARQRLRCSNCGFVQSGAKEGKACPACGAEALQSYEDRLDPNRARILGLRLHPASSHAGPAFAATLLGLAAAMAAAGTDPIRAVFLESARVVSVLVPVSIAIAALTGLVDAKVRLKTRTTRILVRKIVASALFFANDIVNIASAAVFLLIVILAKPPRGLFIGVDAALVYLAIPLVHIYGLSPLSLAPIAVAAASAYGIADALKIEEVLVNEKAPIKLEHLAYIAISAVFCVLFIVRGMGVLLAELPDAGERITSIADLVLAALWLVLTGVALVNAAKRVPALTGIMTSGAALEFSLILFFVLDAATRKEGRSVVDIAVVAVMSLVFVAPAIRLLRKAR